MSRNGFPAARPISPDAIFLGRSILILVTFVIAWAPRCQAGSEIGSGTGMGYTVFATGLAGPRGLLFSRSGDLIVAEQSGGSIVRITPDGSVNRFAKGLSAPHDLAFDVSGYLYVADTGANRVARVSPEGLVSTYIPGLDVPVDLAFHPNGELFVCELYAGTVTAYKSGKKIKVVASGLDKPHGLAFDNTGITYINEWSGNLILKMDRKGRLQPVATVEDPVGIAIGKSGDLYVAQPQAGKVSRVKMDGTREAGNLFVAETGAGRSLKLSGDY